MVVGSTLVVGSTDDVCFDMLSVTVLTTLKYKKQ